MLKNKMLKKLKEKLKEIHNWLIKEENFLETEESKFKMHLKKWLIPHHYNNHRPYLTHHHTISAVLVIIICLKLVVVSTLIPINHAFASGVDSEGLIAMTNTARASNRVASLKTSQELTLAAKLKAEDMFRNQYWSHNSPAGIEPWHWIEEANYVYQHAGENLAIDFHSNEGLFEAWENSRAHWENIINPEFREIGIAVVPGVMNGESTILVVQMFGTRLNHYIPPANQVRQGVEAPVINKPKDNIYINIQNPEISGLAENGVLVHILDDDKNIGKVPTDESGYYTYRSFALLDGEHKFKAYSVKNEEKSIYSNLVKVTIDTKAPVIKEESIEVNYDDSKDVFTLVLEVSGNPEKIQVLSEEFQIDLNPLGGDFYQAEMRFQKLQKSYSVTLHALDKALNSAALNLVLEKNNFDSNLALNQDDFLEKFKNKEEEIKRLKEEKIEKLEKLKEKGVVSLRAITSNDSKGEVSSKGTEGQSNKEEIASLTDATSTTADRRNDSLEAVRSKGTEGQRDKVEKENDEKVLTSTNGNDKDKTSNLLEYIKIGTFLICSIFFLAYLLQAYVVYHKGLQERRAHPIFHAVSILCIMLLVLII